MDDNKCSSSFSSLLKEISEINPQQRKLLSNLMNTPSVVKIFQDNTNLGHTDVIKYLLRHPGTPDLECLSSKEFKRILTKYLVTDDEFYSTLLMRLGCEEGKGEFVCGEKKIEEEPELFQLLLFQISRTEGSVLDQFKKRYPSLKIVLDGNECIAINDFFRVAVNKLKVFFLVKYLLRYPGTPDLECLNSKEFKRILTKYLVTDDEFYSTLLMRLGCEEGKREFVCDEKKIEEEPELLQLLLFQISRTAGTVLDQLMKRHPFLRNLDNSLLQKVPIDTVRLHLCGPGCAGKTTLKYQMERNLDKLKELQEKPISKTRTTGVEIQNNTSVKQSNSLFNFEKGMKLNIFDHGGQQEFHVTYSQLLSYPMSVFVILIPVCENPVKDKTGAIFHEASTQESVCLQLKHWLCYLNTLAHPSSSRVVVVLNTFGECSERFLNPIVASCGALLKDLKETAENLTDKLIFTPFIISCTNKKDWRSKLYPVLNLAVETILKDKSSIPVLCKSLATIVQHIRHEVRVTSIKDFCNVARASGPPLSNLSNASISTLLGFLEHLGEVLLLSNPIAGPSDMKAGDPNLDLVVLHPHWFCCDVLGTLFTYQYSATKKSMIQTIDSLVTQLSPLLSEYKVTFDIDSQIPNILRQMRLCVPMPSSKEGGKDLWFMTFMEECEMGKKTDSKTFNQEEKSESFWRFVMSEDASKSHCAGRLLSLTTVLDTENSQSSNWKIFLSGSFSRFQMRVAEAFSCLTDDDSRVYIPSFSPYYLSLTYNHSDGSKAELFAQMMIDSASGLSSCCRMWLMGSSLDAVEMLLESNLTNHSNKTTHEKSYEQIDALVIDRVLEQFMEWFQEACRVNDMIPQLYCYCIHPDAKGMSHFDTLKDPTVRSQLYFNLESTRNNHNKDPGNETFITRLVGGKLEFQRAPSLLPSPPPPPSNPLNESGVKEKLDNLASLVMQLTNNQLESDTSAGDSVLNQVLDNQTLILNSIASNNQLNRLLVNNPLGMPRVFILIPVNLKDKNVSLVNKISGRLRFYTTSYKMFFICPVSGNFCITNNGEGYKLNLPKEWAQKYGPAVKFSLTICSVLVGLPANYLGIPNPLEPLREEISKALDPTELAQFLKEIDALTPKSNSDPTVARDEAYRLLSAEVMKIDPSLSRCGCKWVVSDDLGEDTYATWVSPEKENQFKREGKRALLPKIREELFK